MEEAGRTGDPIATTTVSLFELLTPAQHRRLRNEERVIRRFARQTAVLGLDFEAAEEASKILSALLRVGRPINSLDALIGGIAVSNNANRIVTFDRDFQRVGEVADIEIQLL